MEWVAFERCQSRFIWFGRIIIFVLFSCLCVFVVSGGLDAVQTSAAVHIFAHTKIAAAAAGYGCVGHRIAAAICARNTLRDRYVCHTNQFQFYDSPLRTKVCDAIFLVNASRLMQFDFVFILRTE